VVLGVTNGGLIFDGAEVLIDAAGLRVARSRARSIDGGVEVVRAEQPRALGTYIRQSEDGFERQLLLDIEIPLLGVGGPEIGVERRSRGRTDELVSLLLFGRRRRTERVRALALAADGTVAAEFGAVRIGLNRELLDRVRVGERKRSIEVGILVFAPVQGIHVRARDAAVDGVARRARALVQRAAAYGARNQDLQLEDVAAVEGQLGNPHPVDRLANDAGWRLHQRRRPGPRRLFTHLAHLKGDRNGDLLVHLEVNAGLLVGFESAQFHVDGVAATGNQRSVKIPLFVADARAGIDAGVLIAQYDVGAGHDGARGVLDGHGDRARIELGGGGESAQQECAHEAADLANVSLHGQPFNPQLQTGQSG